MRSKAQALVVFGCTILALIGGSHASRLAAKEKPNPIGPNDPTLRLYNLLDSKFNGKLDDIFLLSDIAADPKNPGQPQQHVLRVDYNKDRAFGKLSIHVRTVGQLTPEQLKAYNAKQIYDYAETDSAKFTKTDPGSLGRPGDLYLEPTPDGGAMATVPITPEIQAQYDRFVSQYLLPILEKKASGSS